MHEIRMKVVGVGGKGGKEGKGNRKRGRKGRGKENKRKGKKKMKGERGRGQGGRTGTRKGKKTGEGGTSNPHPPQSSLPPSLFLTDVWPYSKIRAEHFFDNGHLLTLISLSFHMKTHTFPFWTYVQIRNFLNNFCCIIPPFR